jgi:hypothetical protein
VGTARTTAIRGAAAAAAVLLAAGCGASSQATDAEDAAKRSSASRSTSAEPMALSGLAGVIGCRPDVQTDEQDIKQANCSTRKGRYVMVTFTSGKGQKTWLSMSKDYGGTYLVGNRWVITASPAALLPVQRKLGGSFEEGTNHSEHSG